MGLGFHLVDAAKDGLEELLVGIGRGLGRDVSYETLVVLFEGRGKDVLSLLLDDRKERCFQGVLVFFEDLVNTSLELFTGAFENQIISTFPPGQLLVLLNLFLNILL